VGDLEHVLQENEDREALLLLLHCLPSV
jgi:hypothetical protein